MDALARYIGLVEAINHTGRRAYFTKSRSGYLKFVCHISDFDPRENKAVFITLMDAVVKNGAVITVHHNSMKNSTYVRYEAVMEINKQIYRSVAMGCQQVIVSVITKYLNNLEHEKELSTK